MQRRVIVINPESSDSMSSAVSYISNRAEFPDHEVLTFSSMEEFQNAYEGVKNRLKRREKGYVDLVVVEDGEQLKFPQEDVYCAIGRARNTPASPFPSPADSMSFSLDAGKEYIKDAMRVGIGRAYGKFRGKELDEDRAGVVSVVGAGRIGTAVIKRLLRHFADSPDEGVVQILEYEGKGAALEKRLKTSPDPLVKSAVERGLLRIIGTVAPTWVLWNSLQMDS